ncbi:hypothetical protein ABI59_20095 [Acidobacteria bacterium Mor1]|nr:hypothetical protein ABI59_20095 [Acidobacteria bacterium Mor1]
MSEQEPKPAAGQERRGFLDLSSRLTMLLGLAGAYGGFAAIAARFLYPAKPRDTRWTFVAEIDRFKAGDSVIFQGPSGETINIARQRESGEVDDFIALSSTCPHLGCQVFWEGDKSRFFCPCHNGIFDASGKGVGGPPGDSGQSLPRYQLKLEGALLFIELPAGDAMARGKGRVIDRVEGIHAAGHDPCLAKAPNPVRDGERA